MLIATQCLAAQSALAGSMPQLPELPPLPTDYAAVAESSGLYAGILSGPVMGQDLTGGLAVVVGNTFVASDLLIGLEIMGGATMDATASIEAVARLGIPLGEDVSVFANLGVGTHSDDGAFGSTGAAIEVSIGNGWILRGQYHFAHDFSSDQDRHAVMAGLVRYF
ncbi:MAG TPA: hypothetical protein VL147_12595 [Devosia sp.]|nr:hypothetical protein [Devosia sp.]